MTPINHNQQEQSKITCKVLQLLVVFFICILNLLNVSACADSPHIIQPHQVFDQRVSSQDEPMNLKNRAKMWGLTINHFKHYLWLMKNTPSGHWYQQLDPAEVLALSTKDPDEMMRYAKIQARNMHRRVTRELIFNKLFTKAYKTLYPNEKPIMPQKASGLEKGTLQSGDHMWLFVGVNTPLGRFAYQHLIKIVQASMSTMLDIYFVGNNVTQKNIQRWAINAGLSHSLVNKQVTLNVGNHRFQSLTKGQRVHLPFIGIVHDNHFQPISLSSVLSFH